MRLVWFENVEWCMAGSKWYGLNYISTFFKFFHSFHQILISHIKYNGGVGNFLTQMENWATIGGDLKLYLK